jgi:hypothetical protein
MQMPAALPSPLWHVKSVKSANCPQPERRLSAMALSCQHLVHGTRTIITCGRIDQHTQQQRRRTPVPSRSRTAAKSHDSSPQQYKYSHHAFLAASPVRRVCSACLHRASRQGNAADTWFDNEQGPQCNIMSVLGYKPRASHRGPEPPAHQTHSTYTIRSTTQSPCYYL